jgi:hypothetical protein
MPCSSIARPFAHDFSQVHRFGISNPHRIGLRHNMHRGRVAAPPPLQTEELKTMPPSSQPAKHATYFSAVDGLRAIAALSEAEAADVQASFTRKGARVVLEAPKPLFLAPAFRCTDWFNRANPICASGLTLPRSEEESLRAPVVAAMAQLAKTDTEVHIWDPLPTLYPEPEYWALLANGPVFFYGDHVTGHANDLLYSGFRSAIRAR